MPLSPIAQRAFDAWMAHDSWAKGNDQDMGRFYKFVWMVSRYSRKSVSPAELRELIKEKWSGRLHEPFLDRAMIEYSSRYEDLLDFAKARNAGQLILPSKYGY